MKERETLRSLLSNQNILYFFFIKLSFKYLNILFFKINQYFKILKIQIFNKIIKASSQKENIKNIVTDKYRPEKQTHTHTLHKPMPAQHGRAT